MKPAAEDPIAKWHGDQREKAHRLADELLAAEKEQPRDEKKIKRLKNELWHARYVGD